MKSKIKKLKFIIEKYELKKDGLVWLSSIWKPKNIVLYKNH